MAYYIVVVRQIQKNKEYYVSRGGLISSFVHARPMNKKNAYAEIEKFNEKGYSCKVKRITTSW